jgi:hypothetical protein
VLMFVFFARVDRCKGGGGGGGIVVDGVSG